MTRPRFALIEKLDPVLRYMQVFLYLAFLTLWFKGNFVQLRGIRISYLVPLLPLLLITALRVIPSAGKIIGTKTLLTRKDILAVLALILIALAVRIPFLIHHNGLLDSDDANSILVSKHIAEGKVPPVYHYGQFYLGTFNYHIYALAYKLFGFSVLAPLLICLLIYLGFVSFQYFFFKSIFSSRAASFCLALFYCLPLGHLPAVSIHLGISFPLVLLLGGLSIHLSYRIFQDNQEKLAAPLGFILGLNFWLHPSSVAFATTSFILAAARFRLRLKNYLPLFLFAAVGAFPIILAEACTGFEAFKHIFLGVRTEEGLWERALRAAGDVISLISSESHSLNYVYFLFLCLGVFAPVFLALKKKKFQAQCVFPMFFFVFLTVYLISRHSYAYATFIRYLYPLYFALPALLFGALILLKPKIKHFLILGLTSVLVFASNFRVTTMNFGLVKKADAGLRHVMEAMQKTGQKYWAGDFWQAHLLTALSGEKIIGWPYTHEDYYPYGLEYHNQGENNNLVFFREPGSYAVKFKETIQDIDGVLRSRLEQGQSFIRLLEKLKIGAKVEKVGEEGLLVYDIAAQVLPPALEAPVPDKLPRVTLSRVRCMEGYLNLTFQNEAGPEDRHFRLRAEVPGYSSAWRNVPPNKQEIELKVPFPHENSVRVRYYLEYFGLSIPETLREISYSPAEEALREKRTGIVFLSGTGPVTEAFGKKRRILEKEVRLEINRKLDENSLIRLRLYSTFDFSNPLWYGDYSQEVRMAIEDGETAVLRLQDGDNVIEFDPGGAKLQGESHTLTLTFRYHLFFRALPPWKTAALLNEVEIIHR